MKKSLAKLLSLALVLLLTFSTVLPASAASAPAKVSSLESYRIDDDEINLKWKKASGAYVYQVYVYSNGDWRYVGGTKKLRYEVENLASSKEYNFKVRAYKFSGNKKVYGPFSEVITVATEPDEVEKLTVSAVYKKTVSLNWRKQNNVTGYQVYVYSPSKDKYVKVASVKNNSATIRELNTNTSYRFKVRAYFKADSDVYYGEFSDVVSVKTKKSSASTSESADKNTNGVIGASKAASIALKNANLKKSQVRDFSCELDVENGVKVYEVDFDYGKYEYSYDIDAYSGKILHREKERD